MVPADAKSQLLEFLLNPRSYPHQPKRVRLIQTHSAWVFIAMPWVYKVKKPVSFGFLDFSTLEKRRNACARELELNRRLSQGVYWGVVAITAQGGQLRWGGEGRTVEYAVKMKYLPERYLLDGLVRDGRFTDRDLRRLVKHLGSFYRAQRPTPSIEDWGRPSRLRISTEENATQTREFIGRTISSGTYDAVQEYTRRFLRSAARFLGQRVQQKWIRDCHGDLHLEHIHLTPRSLQIYDCIEFNDRFRYVDVASDIAFLAMDLDHEKRPDLARRLVALLARDLEDPKLERLMPFYKCYRAYVRGKVESLHSQAATAPPAERKASSERATGYFQLALNYAVGASNPMVLAVMGRIGSGKSSVSRALAQELGWELISSDAVRKQLAGFPLYVRTSQEARHALYSERRTRQTYRVLLDAALRFTREGKSVVLDATFARRKQRDEFRRALNSRGVTLRFVELHASDSQVRRRLRQREFKDMEVSDARLEDFPILSKRYEVPTELPSRQRLTIISRGKLETVAGSALKALARLEADAEAEAD